MWWSAFIWQVLSPRVSPMLRWTPIASYRYGVPERCHKDRVLSHMHAGGSVVWSIHTDRKAVGHIAKTVGVRAPLVGFRHAPNTSTPHKSRTSRKPIAGSSNKGFVPKNIASIGHSIGGNLAVNRAVIPSCEGAAR